MNNYTESQIKLAGLLRDITADRDECFMVPTGSIDDFSAGESLQSDFQSSKSIRGEFIWELNILDTEAYPEAEPPPAYKYNHSTSFGIGYNSPRIMFDGVVQFAVVNGRTICGINTRSREWDNGAADGSVKTWTLDYYDIDDNYLGESDPIQVPSTTDGTANETYLIEADVGEAPPEGTASVWLYAGGSFSVYESVMIYDPNGTPNDIPPLDSVFNDANAIHFSSMSIPQGYVCGSGLVSATQAGSQVDLSGDIKALVYAEGGQDQEFIQSISFEFRTIDDEYLDRSFGTNLSFTYNNSPYKSFIETSDTGYASPIPEDTGFVWMLISGDYVGVWRLSEI